MATSAKTLDTQEPERRVKVPRRHGGVGAASTKVAGATPMWEWAGSDATVFSY